MIPGGGTLLSMASAFAVSRERLWVLPVFPAMDRNELVEAIVGLRKPASGTIKLRDRDITFTSAGQRSGWE